MPVALVTGISGQDGSYLAESLLAQGYDVHGVVRSANPEDGGNAGETSGVTLHTLDIADTSALSALVSAVAPDEIYNLAAVSSVFRSWAEPVHTAEINALPVAAMLEAAWKLEEQGHHVRFVQASSAELFGQAEVSPQNESTPIRPSSPYGAAKAYAHHMVGVYRQRGLFASNCILYNHESPRRPEAFVTRKITSSVARISRGLQESLELGNLDARRDWGWAPDFARALELAVRAERADDFVIATGVTHSIADFVSAAFARVGITEWQHLVSINEAFSRPVDPAEQVGDARKAREVLGWHTTVDFDEIVGAMVDADLALLDTSL